MLIMLILGSAAMTVEAVRVRALNFVMNVEPEYSSFALKENNKHSEKTVDWHKAYAPTFIPEGYEGVKIAEGVKYID